MTDYHLHRNSLIAWASGAQAITFGSHIFVRGPLVAVQLLRHERAHVAQYARLGVLGFLVRYAYYAVRYGYRDNPLEVEARWAERG